MLHCRQTPGKPLREVRGTSRSGDSCVALQTFEFGADFFLAPAKFFLKASEQFILFPFSKHQIIVGEISILLL